MKSLNYLLIGQRVKELRQQNALTQDKLAELCDVSTSYLGHIERGSRNLSLETAYKISKCLKVSLDSLIIDGINENNSTLVNIDAILKKHDAEARKKFNRIAKVIADNIDEI